jgi:hypothetical protein
MDGEGPIDQDAAAEAQHRVLRFSFTFALR